MNNIYLADVSTALNSVTPTYNNLKIHSKIPINAKAMRPKAHTYAQIATLHQSIFDIDLAEVIARLEGKSHIVNYCNSMSTVIMREDNVLATTIVLQKRAPQLAYIYAIIVDSNWQNSWVSAYLKYYSLNRLHTLGIRKIGFQVYNKSTDTIKFINKVNAQYIVDPFDW